MIIDLTTEIGLEEVHGIVGRTALAKGGTYNQYVRESFDCVELGSIVEGAECSLTCLESLCKGGGSSFGCACFGPVGNQKVWDSIICTGGITVQY